MWVLLPPPSQASYQKANQATALPVSWWAGESHLSAGHMGLLSLKKLVRSLRPQDGWVAALVTAI